MLKSLVKILGLVIGLVLSSYTHAISMGDINVTNTLGEPMNVLIELGTARKDEISSLSARLAPPEVFADAGLDYPSELPPLKFKIETNANGEPYIKVTSMQPINQPFVNLLVELTWSSGKLLREYTFLLDPPGYVPTLPQPAKVQPVAPRIVDVAELEPKATEKAIESPFPSTALMMDEKKAADTIVEKKAVEEVVKETPASVNKPKESSNVALGTITVIRGDTLSDLALQTKSPDVSLERALVALYHANADAFDGKNMNRLKTGKILRMPEQSAIDNQSQVEAVKQIRAQAEDWHAYRQKLAAASGFATGNESMQEASGKINTSVADDATVAKESAKEVVRLSKGEALGDNANTLQNKIQALEEEAISKSKALQESGERVVALEKTVQDLQRLIDLKNQPLAEQVKPVQKPVKPIEKSKLVATQPSMLERILREPLYLVGVAAVLLGLIGLVYAVTRRRKDSKGKVKLGDKPIEHSIGSLNQPVMPLTYPSQAENVTNDIATTSDTNQPQTDDFDPISGADLFLNFGRDEQAEKILKEGLSKNPANHQIHLKLLSIYANRKDTHSFATIARQLRDSGDVKAWEQAAIMGLKLEPNNPMYGGTVRAAVEEASFDATPSPNTSLDEGKTNKTPSALDFDLDLDFSTPTVSPDSAETSLSHSDSKNATVDFDVTASHTKLSTSNIHKEETSAVNLDNSVLDVTAEDTFIPAAPLHKTEVSAPANLNEPMDFTLDFPDAIKSVDKLEVPPVKAAPKEIMDIGLSDINLSLDKPDVPPPALAAEERDARWHDAATKLDLAKAYQEMGDAAGAREILEEVVREGDEQHRRVAEALLQQLPI
ncbi:Motility protein FimV [Candidatus Nitrotoga sp. BS]|uniref:FimV/HubP family polar landmark protein n=1 Tax=Candidatus Nitrotoga sp. BS TaxID=2890408 RepID=UPI001EF2F2E0|nr:FimV/HubP family polar landmark protein [Candidatus Nitrotoga sp. BS]CAH1194412.1 Motility protein FimV [Candidatus Nitrotoga sp. BS]